jgi:hypothetical protein
MPFKIVIQIAFPHAKLTRVNKFIYIITERNFGLRVRLIGIKHGRLFKTRTLSVFNKIVDQI